MMPRNWLSSPASSPTSAEARLAKALSATGRARHSTIFWSKAQRASVISVLMSTASPDALALKSALACPAKSLSSRCDACAESAPEERKNAAKVRRLGSRKSCWSSASWASPARSLPTTTSLLWPPRLRDAAALSGDVATASAAPPEAANEEANHVSTPARAAPRCIVESKVAASNGRAQRSASSDAPSRRHRHGLSAWP
mmetsp:Transcript_24650/g.79779  ORF Transcript_24650/g.79779 Transcript_24650/m.79779 type:complete len:200 (-) Transcript_24650:18-617(-)